MEIRGEHLIAGAFVPGSGETFTARDARSGEPLPGEFREGTNEDVDRALQAAAKAFPVLRDAPAAIRAALLEAIAEEVENLGDALLKRTDEETALGEGRLTGERARCAYTARLFAEMIREGEWVDARIERAIPDRQPLPKPDIRLMHRPVGPAVIFGASNFPYAISVVGTDTISALGAGCPVVVKAHPAHPGTCEWLGLAVTRAVERLDLPKGTFSLLHGKEHEVGLALVDHPLTEVVAFTGSLKGGTALAERAQQRDRPIPFYGEMGSLNPVFLFPSSLEASSEAIQTGFVQSLTLGMGQFCTNPALVLGVAGPQWDQFVAGAAEKVSETPPGAMLHAGIGEAYAAGVELLRRVDGVNVVGEASASIHEAGAVLAETSLEVFEREFALLSQEIFGPASILVTCPSVEDFQRVAASLEVSLSATLHVDEGEVEEAQSLLRSLEGKTGRLIVNGFPTGLEVCGALHHGGGFPASSHGFFTSVGTNAIYRFVRPICYQGVPDALLPPELQDANPLGVSRREG